MTLNENSIFNSRLANATPMNERMSIREGTILYTTIQAGTEVKKKPSSSMLRKKSNASQNSRTDMITNIKVSAAKKSQMLKMGNGTKNTDLSEASFVYQHSVSEKKNSVSDVSNNEFTDLALINKNTSISRIQKVPSDSKSNMGASILQNLK